MLRLIRTEGDSSTERRSLQLRVLLLGLLEDRDVGVSVFPKCQEVLICRATLGRVTLQSVSACEAETSERADGLIQNDAPVGKNFLKFCRSFADLMRG